ncbi:MAG: stage II sporulation protein M [Candidatus Nanohaloarchaea archaeon]|nr:stage II sporulation protein M [Candidatus Nanohaloarchaea archaeon]
MFERLVLRSSDSERYLDIFFLSLFFTVLSVLLVQHVVVFQVGGRNLGGVIAVLLTSLTASYPFVSYLLEEERMELQRDWAETKLLKRHAHQLELYLSFFLGSTTGFALSTFIAPESFYSVQLQVLESIRSPTGMAVGGVLFREIVRNNLWVFSLTFLLTFFIASGVLFVLAWNASVLGVLIGTTAGSALHVPALTLFYLPHGLLEVGGYVLAGIAGALLSYRAEAGMLGEGDADGSVITCDAAVLVAAGIAMILLAAAIEVL